MNNEQQRPFDQSTSEEWRIVGNASCERDAEGHCITCSDEALEVRVLRVEEQSGIAIVSIEDTIEEVDITLLEHVVPGNMLLVHGGVAIANLDGETVGVSNG